MLVTAQSPAVGQTAAELGLASQQGLTLSHIERDGATLPTHNLSHLVINCYDELYVTGDMTQVDALAAQLRLAVMTHESDDDSAPPPAAALLGGRPRSDR